MRFPGRRKSKHYFPVSERGRIAFEPVAGPGVYVVGIDQLLVDIEAKVEESHLKKYGVPKGGSVLLDDATVEQAYTELKAGGNIIGEYAGGSIGNTIHNYSVLADDHSVLLGSISSQITVGDYAFHYVRNTSSRVSLNHLHPAHGPMGRAICFVTPDGERSFGVSRGIMNELPASAIPPSLIAGATAVLLTAYLLRDERAPIFGAAMKAIEVANQNAVPVILSLGTATLVREKREMLREIYRTATVSVMAGNLDEVAAITGQDDPLLAASEAIELCDMVLLTRDKHGLYIGAWTDEEYKRETKDPIHSKSIAEYNAYEYSRAMARRDCTKGMKVFSHINPYLGGPSEIRNTNGAGDSALAALLHDMAANRYHQLAAPKSPKHQARFLTYSSVHQICKYANRVSFEVLRRNSPRLVQALPEREDSLEESYWAT